MADSVGMGTESTCIFPCQNNTLTTPSVESLSGGSIAGIVIGVLVAICGTGGGIILCRKFVCIEKSDSSTQTNNGTINQFNCENHHYNNAVQAVEKAVQPYSTNVPFDLIRFKKKGEISFEREINERDASGNERQDKQAFRIKFG